ncbi:MAG TPA: septum formation initiator family protein [Bacillota bacterium]|jgi:cell division protein FtsB|nr:hypothetical protein [Fastidiosipila sp.]HPX93624.1 septum formation initiator family protein [Bacillota bacterium]HQB81516.1 septum formation initiator family protein [Bacillota bacterium]
MRLSYAENRRVERRQSSLSFLARFFAGVAAIVILTLCVSAYFSQQSEFERLTAERRKLERERDRLYERYESLKSLDEIAESNQYIERIARDYLRMAMPGDILIITD